MVSALPSFVVIECPHCGTRYQLPPEAIGPKGRKVACAHCGEAWQAEAVAVPAPKKTDDALFDAADEAALDADFASEERAVSSAAGPTPSAAPEPHDEDRQRTIAEIKAAIAPRSRPALQDKPADPKADKRRQKAFTQRQAELSKSLPLARVRRVLRFVGLGTLVSLLVLGLAFRTDIVKQFPDLAGVYESLGLGVNVIGLEFRDVTTLVALRGGDNVMRVDARIYSVAAQGTTVPPVVITLLDADGGSLYEWSVVPEVRELEPGEVVDFSTQLASPPPAAKQVRLTFNDGNGRSETPITTAAATSD
jgi:predicted Zn finger-like uncharacterized protein